MPSKLIDPEALPIRDKTAMNFGSGSVKAWRDVWGAGQGVGTIADAPATADLVARLARDYAAARARLAGRSAAYADEPLR